jgi:hypothetical protein
MMLWHCLVKSPSKAMNWPPAPKAIREAERIKEDLTESGVNVS